MTAAANLARIVHQRGRLAGAAEWLWRGTGSNHRLLTIGLILGVRSAREHELLEPMSRVAYLVIRSTF